MKTRLLPFILLICLSLGWVACDDTQEQSNDLTKDSLFKAPPVEENKDNNKKNPQPSDANAVRLNLTQEDLATLAVLDEKLLGLAYHDLKTKFPQLKGIRPEDGNINLANEGYTESVTEMKLISKKVKVKFNFRNDSLYKYSLQINETDATRADNIFNGLITQYSDTFGSPELVPVEEENHYFKSYKWALQSADAIITYDMNKGDIVWGMQKK